MRHYFIVLILITGCASTETQPYKKTLIECIKEYPNTSKDLAYAYCSVKFDIINRNKK